MSTKELSTEELAVAIKIKSPSIRTRYCLTGSYFCLRPTKMPNGRLMWPSNSVDLLKAAV